MRVGRWALVSLCGLALCAKARPTEQHAFHIDEGVHETGIKSLPFLRSWSMRTLELPDGKRIRRPEALKRYLQWSQVHFVDVTDTEDLGMHTVTAQAPSFPTELRYEAALTRLFGLLSEDVPRAYLSTFTSFFTRYYRSESGAKSQRWLQAQVEELAASLRSPARVDIFQHPWKQSSILLRIPGANDTLTRERGVTILGAHLDSTNLFPLFPAPGADDDGSGTVTLLEALRVLGEAGWAPETDVEIHWYSAEEGGLLGSRAVAAHYERAQRPVRAMLQMDMTAFVKRGIKECMSVVTDYVSPALTDFVERLIRAYIGLPIAHSAMHYAASDHASWTQAGYPSAFVIEAVFEDCNLQRIHTSRDVWNAPEISFAHLLQFARLSLSFVVELAGWADV
ncbi:bacterial leucyl aminopeptidase [Malassezia nana]|uniref:Peptide hydrolase n=1 Tax=Malassezia nana TaxID=180528 RepID=A0AAF0EGT7_9BASI|nr:bacterial leucyl aminopeptidase [Malassezia nana]